MPEWAKSFTSLVAHLVPMIGSLTLLDPVKIPKQIKSALALGLMYTGVWGNSKFDSYPKVTGITVASSLLSDGLKLPNFARRSILALLLSGYQHFSGIRLNKLEKSDFIDLGKKFLPKLLEMELKINTSVPLSEALAKKSNNKLASASVQVLGISGIVTAITELIKRLGLRANDAEKDSSAMGDACPVCGEAHAAGECVAADIAPTLSASANPVH